MHSESNYCASEFKRAIEKHGVSKTPANPIMTNGDRIIILVEEVGEVARAMTYDEGNPEEAIKELHQVATMALAAAIGIKLGMP